MFARALDQGIRLKRGQIRIRKITVIVREFLGPHEKGFTSDIVPTARLLLHPFTALQDADLTANLVSESAPDTADGVQILEFDFCSEFGLVFRAYRNIAIAAELSLLHISIAHCAVDQDLFQRT